MKTIKPAGYKKLALGIALACGVNSAQAAVVAANDVFLSVWDSTSQTSFTADLGVALNTFVTQIGSNLTFQLDTAFANWVTAEAGHTLTYNIAGVNKITPTNTTLDSLLMSHEAGSVTWSAAPNFNTLASNQTNVNKRIINVNATGTELVTDPTQQGYFNTATGQFWGVGEGSSIVNASTTVGNGGLNQLAVQYINTPFVTSMTNATIMNLQTLNGFFSLNLANSTLNWTSTAVASVPVPAAVWLFLGGLMTILGFQKRKAAFAA